LERAGFAVSAVRHVFGGQYLWAEAVSGRNPSPNPLPEAERGLSAPPSPAGKGAGGLGSAYRNWALASSALAACLLVAVAYLALTKPGPEVAAVNWGWAKPGGVPREARKPAEYLNALAATSEEWFDKRPDDAAGVAKRINEFRTGCSQLVFAPHAALAQVDRDWLVERCRAWAKKLDDHLTELERGGDALKVRGDADETIRKLQAALRERATQVG
jgi:hypothetical protein